MRLNIRLKFILFLSFILCVSDVFGASVVPFSQKSNQGRKRANAGKNVPVDFSSLGSLVDLLPGKGLSGKVKYVTDAFSLYDRKIDEKLGSNCASNIFGNSQPPLFPEVRVDDILIREIPEAPVSLALPLIRTPEVPALVPGAVPRVTFKESLRDAKSNLRSIDKDECVIPVVSAVPRVTQDDEHGIKGLASSSYPRDSVSALAPSSQPPVQEIVVSASEESRQKFEERAIETAKRQAESGQKFEERAIETAQRQAGSGQEFEERVKKRLESEFDFGNKNVFKKETSIGDATLDSSTDLGASAPTLQPRVQEESVEVVEGPHVSQVQAPRLPVSGIISRDEPLLSPEVIMQVDSRIKEEFQRKKQARRERSKKFRERLRSIPEGSQVLAGLRKKYPEDVPGGSVDSSRGLKRGPKKVRFADPSNEYQVVPVVAQATTLVQAKKVKEGTRTRLRFDDESSSEDEDENSESDQVGLESLESAWEDTVATLDRMIDEKKKPTDFGVYDALCAITQRWGFSRNLEKEGRKLRIEKGYLSYQNDKGWLKVKDVKDEGRGGEGLEIEYAQTENMELAVAPTVDLASFPEASSHLHASESRLVAANARQNVRPLVNRIGVEEWPQMRQADAPGQHIGRADLGRIAAALVPSNHHSLAVSSASREVPSVGRQADSRSVLDDIIRQGRELNQSVYSKAFEAVAAILIPLVPGKESRDGRVDLPQGFIWKNDQLFYQNDKGFLQFSVDRRIGIDKKNGRPSIRFVPKSLAICNFEQAKEDLRVLMESERAERVERAEERRLKECIKEIARQKEVYGSARQEDYDPALKEEVLGAEAARGEAVLPLVDQHDGVDGDEPVIDLDADDIEVEDGPAEFPEAAPAVSWRSKLLRLSTYFVKYALSPIVVAAARPFVGGGENSPAEQNSFVDSDTAEVKAVGTQGIASPLDVAGSSDQSKNLAVSGVTARAGKVTGQELAATDLMPNGTWKTVKETALASVLAAGMLKLFHYCYSQYAKNIALKDIKGHMTQKAKFWAKKALYYAQQYKKLTMASAGSLAVAGFYLLQNR